MSSTFNFCMSLDKSLMAVIVAVIVPLVGFSLLPAIDSSITNFTSEHPDQAWVGTLFYILYGLAMALTPIAILYITFKGK